MPHAWNLAEWVHNLGLKRKDQPEFVYGVQPVTILGDQSGWTSPILPPMAWTGAQSIAGGAGTYGCLSLTSRAPGGTFVRCLEWLTVDGGFTGFTIDNAPVAMANLTANPYRYDVGQQPTVSVFQMGTIAVPKYGGNGPIFQNASGATRFVDFCYLPSGWTLQMWQMVPNQVQGCAILFEDCPAQQSQR